MGLANDTVKAWKCGAWCPSGEVARSRRDPPIYSGHTDVNRGARRLVKMQTYL